MFDRNLEKKILEVSIKYRCLTLVGPRQSGKTTLTKKLFPKYQYFSFESPNTVELFNLDPKGFLDGLKGSAIFDEVQKVPQILSYLQEILDDKSDGRKFILTGSNNLQLSKNISQSLAGRTKIFHVLPLQRNEISEKKVQKDLDQTLYFGSYPRIYDEELNPTDWLGDYVHTYIEKDIRDTINITSLKSFNGFLRLIAGRVGQLINYNSLGADAGISQPTAKSWLSALETTYICFTLQPHFKNFNKRITKSPKVYFYDTGLLCYLLRIQNIDHLREHPLRGNIFENWVISEKMKDYYNKGEEPPLYFWRDSAGHEIDLIQDEGTFLDLIEIKSGKTFQKEFFDNIKWLNKLQNRESGLCIYGGDDDFNMGKLMIKSWKNL